MATSLETLTLVLARALRPLATQLTTGDDDVVELLRSLGYELPSGPVPPSLIALQDVTGPLMDSLEAVEEEIVRLEEDEGSENDLLEKLALLLLDVGLVATRFGQLPAQLRADLPAAYVATTSIDRDLPTRLYDYLIVQSLEAGATLLTHVLELLGIIDILDQEADPARHQPAFTLHRLRWERIPGFLQDPSLIMSEVYRWGQPELDVERLFWILQKLSIDLFAPAEIEYPDDALLAATGAASNVVPDDGPDPQLVVPFLATEVVTLAIALYPLPLASPAEPRALAATLRVTGTITAEIPLSDRVTIGVDSGVGLEPGVAVIIRPNLPVTLIEKVSSGGAASIVRGARVQLKLRYRQPPAREGDEVAATRMLSAPGGSRLETCEVYLAIEAEASGSGAPSVGVEGGLVGGKLVVTTAEADSFLKSLLPPDGLTLDFDFGAGWSSTRGVHFRGSGALETAVPVHLTVGPLRVDTLHVMLAVAEQGLVLELSVSGAGVLGPAAVSVERIGVLADLGFQNGNLGPADLDLGFKFPTRLGIAINAGPVTGGGFLSLEPAAGRYAGILQLRAYSIDLTAIGLLDTKGPGGVPLPPPGFSFLIIVSARFSPIQLGYGFTLNSVGGLAGIHRTVVVDALQSGLRSGNLDHVLFPENPVQNAPQIVSDLRAIFPPRENRHVFGPMAIIGWGTPTLLEAELGVILEVPEPILLVILGQARLAIPTREAAIVLLQVDVLGVLDFNRKTFALDAVLRDSNVAGFPITGGLAMRLSWGDPPSFAFAIGGLNPHFPPPPGFPALERVTISIGAGENPRISLQGYLALTANSVQFGALAELYAESGGFNVYGWIGFDAFVILIPLSFRADLSAGVALRRGTTRIAGIHLHATLTGPSPFHAWGEACLSLLFCDICVPFDRTFGEPREVELPARDPWPELDTAIRDARNWSATLPPGVQAAVSLHAPPVESPPVLVHPMGSVTMRQRVAPLNRTLERFGEFRISGANRFDVSAVKVGNEVTADWGVVQDFFAPGQFESLSDHEKLSRGSFEKMAAGVAVSSDRVEHGPAKVAPVVYETRIVDSPWDSRPGPSFVLPLDHQLILERVGAKARSPLTRDGTLKYAPEAGQPKGITLQDETYVVATTDDLAPQPQFGERLSQGEAFQALKAHLAAHPEDRERLQVVAGHELGGGGA